jgi:hypothetical protein
MWDLFYLVVILLSESDVAPPVGLGGVENWTILPPSEGPPPGTFPSPDFSWRVDRSVLYVEAAVLTAREANFPTVPVHRDEDVLWLFIPGKLLNLTGAGSWGRGGLQGSGLSRIIILVDFLGLPLRDPDVHGPDGNVALAIVQHRAAGSRLLIPSWEGGTGADCFVWTWGWSWWGSLTVLGWAAEVTLWAVPTWAAFARAAP